MVANNFSHKQMDQKRIGLLTVGGRPETQTSARFREHKDTAKILPRKDLVKPSLLSVPGSSASQVCCGI